MFARKSLESDIVCLKGVQGPAAFAIVCFCLCEFRAVNHSGSCAEQAADFPQGMLVFVLPLKTNDGDIRQLRLGALAV